MRKICIDGFIMYVKKLRTGNGYSVWNKHKEYMFKVKRLKDISETLNSPLPF